MARRKLTDAQYQAKVRRIQEHREAQRKLNWQWLMSHKAGRDLAWYLIFELGKLTDPSFAGGIKDGNASSQHTAYVEGYRGMAKDIQEQLQEANPDAYLDLMIEQTQARKTEFAIEAAFAGSSDEERENG